MMGLPQGEQEHDEAERWLQLIEPADIPKFRGALEACLQGLSQKRNVVCRVRHYQGGTRIFNARATARAPEHGTIRRVVGLTIDITESYAIHMRAERIASVFDAAVGGLAICDAQHQVLEVNDQLAAMCGRSVNALHHMSLDEVLFPDAAEAEQAWATIRSEEHTSELQS